MQLRSAGPSLPGWEPDYLFFHPLLEGLSALLIDPRGAEITDTVQRLT